MKNLFSLTILAAALMFAACSDDTNPTPKTPVQPGTADGFNNLREEALDGLIQKKTFNAGDPVEFTTENGVTFKWNGTLYVDGDKTWTPVTGKVTLEYAEIFERGDMVTANRPLMYKFGKNDDGKDLYKPLVTGGEFYVNMTQDGKQLYSYNSYEITVPGDLTGGINPGMTIWAGDIDDKGNFFWDQFYDVNDPNQTYRERMGELLFDNNNYRLLCNDFCWTNIDILAGEDGVKTPIFVKPPRGWDNKNSCVYVAYKGKAGSLAFLDQFYTEHGYFTEHYGWAPIDMSFYVIFVAEKDGKYVYWIGEIKVKKDTTIDIPQDELKTCTKAELVDKINKLP